MKIALGCVVLSLPFLLIIGLIPLYSSTPCPWWTGLVVIGATLGIVGVLGGWYYIGCRLLGYKGAEL